MPAFLRPRLFLVFIVLSPVFLASCAAPLGPGYSIKKQSLEVHYLSGDPPRLEIHARYQLKNTGNRALSFLEVGLPGETDYGRKNLRATLDGGAAATSALANGAGEQDAVRIPFGRPWGTKEEHALELDYELSERSAGNRGIILTSDTFFLSSAGWYPLLRAPQGLFAEGGEREKPLDLSIRVPQGFLAHASGKPRGVHKESGEIVYRFRIAKEDSDPFVVAGRYFEQRYRNADTTIIFWTLKGPLPKDQSEHAGARLSASLKEYESSFGLPFKKKEPYRVVEMLAWPDSLVGSIPAISTPNFPRGAVIATRDDSSVQTSDYFMSLAAYDLAQSWFGATVRPESGEGLTLPEVLCRYAMNFVAGESFGPRLDRGAFMRRALRQYSQLRTQGKEETMMSMAETKEPGDRMRAVVKGDLFLGALEDRCGQENLRHALRHLVQSLRGSTYGYSELRSALEQECHQDLGPMFRQWLTETGIPADFRARYESRP